MNPLETVQRLRDDYARYLQTIYAFRDEGLRGEFAKALTQPDFLVKGPILQASRPYETGASIAELVTQGILRPGFRDLCSDALPFERPLYRHQEEAIRKVVGQGRNVVVATGTGSGKTEAFLIPILNHLLGEDADGTLQDPGVRALLLYPMNALANDQLRRLRQVLASYRAITFGRYTGETPEDQSEAERQFLQQFPDDRMLPNELISRDRIRQAPPHLLLTNYSMLEYLLLRPIDSELFDGPSGRHWRFVVVDEAHVYDGAAGAELAMLLRRLKDRVVHSEARRIRMIATSATLGHGRDDYPAVVSYASELLGEPVEWDMHDPERQDVIAAQYVAVTETGAMWGSGTPGLYSALAAAVASHSDTQRLKAAALEHGVPAHVVDLAATAAAEAAEPTDTFLYHLLAGDRTLVDLQSKLVTPFYLNSLVAQPDSVNKADYVIDLVALAARARPTPADAPILPARYHTFVRALEGAFLCLNAEHPVHTAGAARLYLSRHERCPACGAVTVELASCPRCGATYVIGQEISTTKGSYALLAPAGDPGGIPPERVRYFVWEGNPEQLDEDEAAVEGTESALVSRVALDEVELCLACGALGRPGSLPCSCGSATARLRAVGQKEGRLSRCVVCGATRGGHPVYRFMTGKDAPATVLATTLYQEQSPSSSPGWSELPGGGRKLLTFSDSRQDAAYFAHYAQRTYEQMLRRALIHATLKQDAPGAVGNLRLADLVGRVERRADDAGMFTAAQSPDERRRLASSWLTHEFAPTDTRLSLEGTGLLWIRPVRPPDWVPPAPLTEPPWNLTVDEAWTLMSVLLDGLRQQGVVAPPPGVDLRDALFRPRNLPLYVRELSDIKRHVLGWRPSEPRLSNRRRDYLCRLLLRRTSLTEGDARANAICALAGLWDYLLSSRPLKGYLISESLRGTGYAYRLDTRFWEWKQPSESDPVYRCTRCGHICYDTLSGVCPTSGCDGELLLLEPGEPIWQTNHYRHAYEHMALVPMEAQEHTAQWRADQAAKIQGQFVRGEVNLLSCSTTFELGVDVGDLDMVFMRNVPPTTANYVQRAGRAGRRTSSVPFVVTFCQRRSHDLYHYRNPIELVTGHVRPPVIELDNEVIARRHVFAVAYASFLRDHFEQTRDWPRRVVAMVQTDGKQTLADMWRAHLQPRPVAIRAALERMLPTSLQDALGVQDWSWLGALTNSDKSGILDQVDREVAEEMSTYTALMKEAASAAEYGLAGTYQRVMNTLQDRDLIGFLASRNILPKYGFPTDVVPLRTDHIDRTAARELELERDLAMAISEYAPGSELVAGGLLWRGGGIYRLPGKEWPSRHYAVCPQCGRFVSEITPLAENCPTCCSGLHHGRGPRGEYIIPVFGFIADRDVEEPGQTPPERTHASRVYFGSYTKEGPDCERQWTLFFANPLYGGTARYSRYGQLHVVNPGMGNAGFRVCGKCGWAMAVSSGKGKTSKHSDPRTGRPCSGMLRTVHLGHNFITDVLELRLSGPGASGSDEALWWSVLYAVVQGACDSLHIARDDIGGTLYRYSAGLPPALVLYDNVPGGAGHLRNVADSLDSVLNAAHSRVANCECGPETSCYQCLRDYYNQYYHDQLKRGLAAGFLGQLLAK